MFTDDGTLPLVAENKMSFNPLKMSEEEYNKMVRNHEGIQFSHSLEEQIGGQVKPGFKLTHLYEERDSKIVAFCVNIFLNISLQEL